MEGNRIRGDRTALRRTFGIVVIVIAVLAAAWPAAAFGAVPSRTLFLTEQIRAAGEGTPECPQLTGFCWVFSRMISRQSRMHSEQM